MAFLLPLILIVLTCAPITAFTSYFMDNLNDNGVTLCSRWLCLGIHALGVSGVLSILIVFLRMPFLKLALPSANTVFDLSLVVHVNLSVLVWMCSIISVIMSMKVRGDIDTRHMRYFKGTLGISVIGTILIVLSAVSKNAIAVKSNYIPVIDNRVFFSGLGIFFSGVLLNTLLSIRYDCPHTTSATSVGTYGIAAMMTSVTLCFITAFSSANHNLTPLQFYEQVFWGAGHLLQGVFSQAFLVVMLLRIRNGRFAHPYILTTIFALNTFSIVLASASHIIYPSDSAALARFFTWHMRIAEAVVPVFLVIFSICNISQLLQQHNRYLCCATVMFLYGSMLGILSIQGTVTVPAHYHGCVVGMTTAFMGFAYTLLPKLGYREVRQHISNAQIYVYSVGQIIHITGLEWLGGYGALRKVTYLPDAASKLAKLCFSVGGSMAIAGGFLFVLLTLNSIYRGKTH